MSCGNPYKHKIQNTIHFFLDTFSGRNSNSRALTDDQMECMQSVSYTHLTLPTNREV